MRLVYANASNHKAKQHIVTGILNKIKSTGRFLKSFNGDWKIVTDGVAREKIAQTIHYFNRQLGTNADLRVDTKVTPTSPKPKTSILTNPQKPKVNPLLPPESIATIHNALTFDPKEFTNVVFNSCPTTVTIQVNVSVTPFTKNHQDFTAMPMQHNIIRTDIERKTQLYHQLRDHECRKHLYTQTSRSFMMDYPNYSNLTPLRTNPLRDEFQAKQCSNEYCKKRKCSPDNSDLINENKETNPTFSDHAMVVTPQRGQFNNVPQNQSNNDYGTSNVVNPSEYNSNDSILHATTLAAEDYRKNGNNDNDDDQSVSTWDELSYIDNGDIDPDIMSFVCHTSNNNSNVNCK
jgi:hypothetical protein